MIRLALYLPHAMPPARTLHVTCFARSFPSMRLSREQRRALNPTANAASPTCNRGCDQTRRLPQDRLITMGKELAMVENNDRGRTFAGSRFEPGRIFGSVNIRTRHGFNQYPTYAGTGPA